MGNEKALQLFSYQGNSIRTVVMNEEIYFVASDVCAFLELGNVSQAVSRIKEKHKDNIIISDVIGRSHSTLCVKEPGLYHLLFTSRKPEAEAFQDWVYEEVLPSIRKAGSYSVGQNVPQEPTPTISDVLRQRALLNERHAPVLCFSTQGELGREIHYWKPYLNASSLDNEARLEQSVGQCFSRYARNTLHIPDAQRRKYPHQLPDGRIVSAWAYPMQYLPDFRQWLYEIYFPEKFDAYQVHRAKRLGVAQALQGATSRKLIATRGVEQLLLF